MEKHNINFKKDENALPVIWKRFRVTFCLAVVEGFVPIITVFCSKKLVQGLLEYQDIWILIFWTLIISVTNLLGKISSHYRSSKIVSKLTLAKDECLKKIARVYCNINLLDAESEKGISEKETAVNIIDFNDTLKNYIESLCKLISNIVSIMGSIYIIFDLNGLLVLIVILISIPEMLVNRKKKKIDFDNMKKWIGLNRKSNCYSSLLTDLKTIKELKVYKADGLIHKSIRDTDIERTNEMIKQEKAHLLWDTLFFLCKTIGDTMIYGYLAVKLLSNEIQIPQFTLYIGGINTLSQSINSIAEAYISWKQYSQYYAGYYDYVSKYTEPDKLSKTRNIEKIDKIEFRNVSFEYPGQNHMALDNISVVIYPNQRLSLVGRNGAGKSTFIKLLLGLFEPTKGNILINDIDIRTISREKLNDLYSVLFQDYNIFPVSVFENVTLKEKNGDLSRTVDMNSIYSKVGIINKIDTLKNYDDTILSTVFEGGVEFSGGEKLKLAIARAFYSDSQFLVLDEPSAALDPKAEYNFYKMISEISGEKTVIFVSHRMTSSMFCDRILVFDQAHIIGDGNHQSLYSNNLVYKSMVDAQRL